MLAPNKRNKKTFKKEKVLQDPLKKSAFMIYHEKHLIREPGRYQLLLYDAKSVFSRIIYLFSVMTNLH